MAGTIPIKLELDENAPIKVLAALHRLPGLAKIHFDFEEAFAPKVRRQRQLLLPHDKSNGHVPQSDSPSQIILALLAQKGGPMTRKEIKSAHPNGGRLVANLTSMCKGGAIRKVAPATFALADAPIANGHSNGSAPKTGVDIIVGMLAQKKAGETITQKEIKVAFDLHGRSAKSVGDACDRARNAGAIVRAGRGLYRLP